PVSDGPRPIPWVSLPTVKSRRHLTPGHWWRPFRHSSPRTTSTESKPNWRSINDRRLATTKPIPTYGGRPPTSGGGRRPVTPPPTSQGPTTTRVPARPPPL